MTLKKNAAAPTISPAQMEKELRALLPKGSLASLGADVPLSGLSVSAPFALHSLAPELLGARGLVDASEQTTWRSLLLHGTTAVGWVTIEAPTDAPPQVISVGVNAAAQSTLDAIAQATALPEVQRGSYELRFLESRGHRLAAIWACPVNPSGASDMTPTTAASGHVFIPVVAPSHIPTHVLYDASALAALLGDATNCAT